MAKGLGILLMTFGHVAKAPGGDGWALPALALATTWVYLFHMPAFFLLGGLTYRAGQDARSFVARKVRTLLVPYVVYSTYFLAKAAFGAVVVGGATVASVVRAIAASAVDVILYGRGLWFLAAYFVGEVVAYAVIDGIGAHGARLALAGIGLYVVSYVLDALAHAPGGFVAPFESINGVRAAGLVCVGAFVRRFLPLEEPSRRMPYAIALAVAVALFLLAGWQCVAPTRFELGWLPQAVAALAGSFMMMLAALLMPCCGRLERVGRASLLYYVVAPELTNIVRVPIFVVLSALGMEGGVLFQWTLTIVITIVILVASRPVTGFIGRHLPWTVGAGVSRAS